MTAANDSPARGSAIGLAAFPEPDFPTWRQVLAGLAMRFPDPETPGAFSRALECAIAGTALVVGLPLMAVMAILIKLDSRGPVLFRQTRVGAGGKLFQFIKFRTFWDDACLRFPHLYSYRFTREQVHGLRFKVPNDPRVTRVGEWLRKTTLDELPNFWHVLTGDMTLVGPRPEIPEMLPYYSDEHLVKFSVRPGLTGLAQVSGRALLSFRQAAQLDADYVRTQSMRRDLRILWRTVALVLRQDGAF